ncbi:MAG: hypothetical protein AAFY17_12940 [Cyanobacteria bacterium J06642_11]
MTQVCPWMRAAWTEGYGGYGDHRRAIAAFNISKIVRQIPNGTLFHKALCMILK